MGLLAAGIPGTTPATPPASRAAGPGTAQASEATGFAALLGKEQALADADTGLPSAPAPDLADAGGADDLEAPDDTPTSADPDAGLPAPPVPLDVPWPPPGLSGLFHPAVVPAAGDLPADHGDATPDLQSRGASRAAAATTASLMAGTVAGSAAAAPTTAAPPAPDASAGMPLPAFEPAPGIDEAAPLAAEGADPAPPAFTLPAPAPPAPARPVAPLLAAPTPTPDVRAGDFSERFGAQLHWMADQGIGHARIRVTPDGLGPVEVVLRMEGDRISADFSSAHAETRQALEQGLPRLRDLLGDQGLQLAHAGVGSDSTGSSQADHSGQGAGSDAAAADDTAAAPAHPRDGMPSRVLTGLLDAYA